MKIKVRKHTVDCLLDGGAEKEVDFQCEGLTFTQSFHVLQHLHAKMIVALDFLQKNNVTVKFGEVKIPVMDSIASGSTIKIATTTITSDHSSIVYPTEEVIVQPHSEILIPTKISGFQTNPQSCLNLSNG